MSLVKRLLVGALVACTALAPIQLEARTHEVTRRDYQGLSGIAERLHVPVKEILACNPGLTRRSILRPRMKLRISNEYVTKQGDTLWNIANRNRTTVGEVLGYNRIRDPDTIKPGMRLELPCRKTESSTAARYAEVAEPDSNGRTTTKPSKPYRHRTVIFPSGLELEVVNNPELTGKGREFYDPNNSANPLLRVPRDRLFLSVSRSFTLAEFAYVPSPSLVRRDYVIRAGGDAYHAYIRLSPFLVHRLEQIRAVAGKPLRIKSGYRPYGYHERLYREVYRREPTTRSRHMSGDGVDLEISDRSTIRRVKDAFARGGIGTGNGCLHVDTWHRRRWNYD